MQHVHLDKLRDLQQRGQHSPKSTKRVPLSALTNGPKNRPSLSGYGKGRGTMSGNRRAANLQPNPHGGIDGNHVASTSVPVVTSSRSRAKPSPTVAREHSPPPRPMTVRMEGGQVSVQGLRGSVRKEAATLLAVDENSATAAIVLSKDGKHEIVMIPAGTVSSSAQKKLRRQALSARRTETTKSPHS